MRARRYLDQSLRCAALAGILLLELGARAAHSVPADGFPAGVNTESGALRGTPVLNGAVMAFQGVPYAAPPVGKLRWKAPAPAVKWQGERRADQPGANCPQTHRPESSSGASPFTAEFFPQGPTSEDCLFLNVWTPARTGKDALPVMVYFHGGGFGAGASSVPVYNGEGLASKGVVVVVVNYRLGLLGFLTSPQLDAQSAHHVSGNYGILDQIASLRWVAHNIAAFGGDPHRVTIFGQSAGGGSVHFIANSPLAHGLFQRAIVESATMDPGDPLIWQGAMSYKLMSIAEEDQWAYLRAAGIRSLEQLRALSVEEILKLPPPPAPSLPPFFRPVLDGYVFPRTFGETYARRLQPDVPTMVGTAAEDLSGVVHLSTTLVEYRQWAKEKFGQLASRFLDLYPAATDEEASVMKNLALHDQNRVTKVTWAEKYQCGVRSKVFIYFWDHPIPGSEQFGAFHTSEVPYVMGSLGRLNRPLPEKEASIAERMQTYWANFAAAGDPNGNGVPVWPAFAPGGANTMRLGEAFEPSEAATSARIDFFRQWFAGRPPM